MERSDEADKAAKPVLALDGAEGNLESLTVRKTSLAIPGNTFWVHSPSARNSASASVIHGCHARQTQEHQPQALHTRETAGVGDANTRRVVDCRIVVQADHSHVVRDAEPQTPALVDDDPRAIVVDRQQAPWGLSVWSQWPIWPIRYCQVWRRGD